MTLLHKFLKKTFFIFLSILLVVTLMIFGRGYLSYQHIVHDIPIEQKIDTIRKSPNYTPLKEVNPYFKNAIYAVEDCRFYQHGAIGPHRTRSRYEQQYKTSQMARRRKYYHTTTCQKYVFLL